MAYELNGLKCSKKVAGVSFLNFFHDKFELKVVYILQGNMEKSNMLMKTI